MKDFSGKLAVITGGGSGIGRALARKLVAEGCDVATCDVLADNLAETRALCEKEASQGRVISTHICDVSDESQVQAFRDAVQSDHNTDHIDLLFNNAGVGGGSSFTSVERQHRAEWERTFNICWYGVYYCARAFTPLLMASRDAHMVNVSSVNGCWATLGPDSAHTAYSAAKFAVKGFTEALINDFANNAPNVKVSVVMPGHIGTSIVLNANRILRDGVADIASVRQRFESLALLEADVSDDEVQQAAEGIAIIFREGAPTTANQAAAVILDGVREERWRILIGEDAHVLDSMVRAAPEEAYTEEFMDRLRNATAWALG